MRQYGQGFLADRLADIEALKQLVRGKAPERDLAATLFRRDEELRVANERILDLVRRVEELERDCDAAYDRGYDAATHDQTWYRD